jgi:MFS family permease
MAGLDGSIVMIALPAIFAVASILLFFASGTGNTAALQIIIFRLLQAVGGAFLFSNSTAIITDRS